ncbi:hypothetical protein ABWK57_36780 [Streptomyces sp. NPDC094045]|nr:hypothetical protein [Streptomyces sp. JV190]
MVTTFSAAATPEQTGPGRAEVLDQVARLADLEESGGDAADGWLCW